MPGTIPATSQLDRLISMTTINVLAGSRAMRDRLKLFNVCMGSSIGSQRTMDAISTPPPHSIFHHGIRGRNGPAPPMKWEHYPNLRRRPPTPSKNRGPVQVRIRRAFLASGAEVLSSSAIYDWTHPRRRCGRSKTLPAGIYWGTLQVLRTMCEPVERVPPHGAWLWRLRNTADD